MLNDLKRGVKLSMLLLAALAVPACTSATEGLRSVPTIQSTEHKIEPGDKIRIGVLDLQGANGEYVIDQSGIISLPLIDDVKISGLTLREAEQAIEQVLLDKRILVRPSVTLQALSVRPVYILGEVGKPGEYDFKEGMTVFAVVSLAGGYTYRADTKAVMVTRTVDGKRVTGKATENTIVMPGDQIRVVEKWF
jgi:protein involved in polysaccharide export with SLBB domain